MKKLLSVLSSTLQGRVRGGLLFVALLATTALWAQRFQVGDLYYNITSSSAPYTVEVTYQDGWSGNNYLGLTTATIPDIVTYNGTTYNVTSIGKSAFYECSSLTSVTIPNSVTSIGNRAFDECSSLTSVHITDLAAWCNIDFVGYSANPLCYAHKLYLNGELVKDLVIPNSVTSIGDYAFDGCSSLTSVTIPNGVTSIGNYAFEYCSSLTSVTIGNSVTSIGYSAFYGCESITKTNYTGDIAGWCKIKFGNASANPISNSHNLYINDQEIQDLVIPNTVDSVQNYAFYECFFLNSVTIPNSVKSIGYNTFQNCCFPKRDFVNNSSLDAEENDYWGAIVGESEVDGLIIQETTVVGCRKNVTNATIPNYITNIGNNAFYDCSALTSITIPNSVTSIGNSAFSNCDSLTKTNYTGDIADWCGIKFNSSRSNPMFYSQNLYINDQEIKDLVIPNSVDSIHDYTFYNGSALSSVSISNSVTSIGNYAFSGCSSLTSVTIPNSVTSLGNCAFDYCSSLTSVILSEGLTSIGNWVFSDCSSLTSIIIPDNVTNIGFLAFQNTGIYNDESNWENNELYIDDCLIAIKINSHIGSYTIKDGVRLIAGGAFWDQYGLTEVIIPNSVKSISTRAFSSTEITSIVIPNSVTNIEQMTFYNCRNLSSVTLGSGLTCIEDRVFEGCTVLKSISIPERVTRIGQRAFQQCNSLDTIILNSNIPPTLDSTAFQKAAQPICYIPCGTSAEYQASSWMNYVDTLVEMCDTKLFYTSADGNVVNPNAHAFDAKIVDNTYSNGQGVITFDRPILTIRQSAFNSCDNLATIMIPKTVTEIEDYAFEDCSTLSSITLPNNITTIGEGTFSGCSSLTSVTIGESMTSIGFYAFDGCNNITSVTWNAKNCNTYNFGSQVTSFEFGNEVEVVPSSLCKGMEKLTSVTIPNSVKTIGTSAFEGCSSLTPVTIPESVTSIGKSAFEGCSAIDSIVWNAKNCADASSLETAPFYAIRSQITSFTFGENVEHIPAYLCDGMEKLTSVTIPDSVKTIGTSAFEGCARLGKISLGTGLEEIAANAFAGCTRLYDIYVYATYPPFAEESSFANYNAYLYIPCESKRDYTMDPVWSKFQHIECLSDEPTDMENIETPSQRSTNCQKLLRNGQLLILRDGKTYNAMGQEL